MEWSLEGGRTGRAGRYKSAFFAPHIFLSPYFSKYTNDETLKTNFKFIDPLPQ